MTYRSKISGATHVVLQKGHVDPKQPTVVRMHAISIFDDVLGQTGPRKRQLQRSMAAIGARGAGLIVLIMPERAEPAPGRNRGVIRTPRANCAITASARRSWSTAG